MVTKPPADSPDATPEPIDDTTAQVDAVPEAIPASSHAAAPPPPAYTPPPAPEVEAPEVVVLEPVVVEPILVEPVLAPPQQVIYVQTPLPPRKASNRGIGSLLAVLGALVFGVLLAGAAWLLQATLLGDTGFDFLMTWDFYVPVIVFAIAFVLLVLVVNRGGWGAYVFGSLIVGAVVFFGTIGIELLLNWLIWQQVDSFAMFAASAFHIVAAILAREVAVWFGWFIASRGKKVTAKNVAARRVFDEQLAEFQAGNY